MPNIIDIEEKADAGESALLTVQFEDEKNDVLDKASILSLTLKLTNEQTAEVINSRDGVSPTSDVLDDNGGTVADSGLFEMIFSEDDNVILGEEEEPHLAKFTWTWISGTTPMKVKQTFRFFVSQDTHDEALAAASVLTSVGEIQRLFSVEGVSNHLEDYNQSDVLPEIIQRATERVLQFLRSRYAMDDMVSHVWVREKATIIACYLLSKRQGNPSLYADDFEEAMLDLAFARDGVIDIGLPTVHRIIVQTPMMDSRFFVRNRIDPHHSTKVFSGQRLPYRVASWE